MPGIFALIGSPHEAQLADEATAMAGRLQHEPWYVVDLYKDTAEGIALGRVSLGYVDTAAQPAFNEDRSLLCVMTGEIYEFDALRLSLEIAGHRFGSQSQAELLLHGFESEGAQFFRRLHGCFAAAIWDVKSRRLVLTGDRFGMRPLYYAHTPGRLIVASEIKALLVDPTVSRSPDRRGISQFFTFGQLLGEHTLLEAVRILPAAGWMVFDANDDRLRIDRYWRLAPGSGRASFDPREALDRLEVVFQQAVDRRSIGADRLGISLSGGLDARTILAVLDHDHIDVTAVSLGVRGSIDLKGAEQLSGMVGCRHHTHLLDELFLGQFEEHLNRLVHLTDGHYLSQCITIPTLPVYRELGIEVLLRGHAGELMHMDKSYNFSFDSAALTLREEHLENWLLRRLRAFLINDVSSPLFAADFEKSREDLARESLREALQESVGFDPPAQRIAHLFLTQRVRRETALSMVEFGSVVETRLPYLDNDLIETLFRVPPGLKLAETIQGEILRRRRPDFLDVINANTGARIGSSRLIRRLAKFQLQVLSKLRIRGYQPYERLGLWLRRELAPLVERVLLHESCLDSEVFEADGVRTIVREHLNVRKNHTFLILAMMIYELGRRRIHGEAWTAPITQDRLAVPTHG